MKSGIVSVLSLGRAIHRLTLMTFEARRNRHRPRKKIVGFAKRLARLAGIARSGGR
jgi:hypothetical protein